jgi:hypothetical protein
MSVPDDVPSRKKRQTTKPPAILRAVPTDGFVMEAAIEMQTVIRYLQQAVKRTDYRYLALIPPDQLAELRALAPALRALADAIDPLPTATRMGPIDPLPAAPAVLVAAPPLAGRPRRGPRKLSDDQVRAIRQRYHAGERVVALAREFQIANSSCFDIVAGKSYQDVPLERVDQPGVNPERTIEHDA